MQALASRSARTTGNRCAGPAKSLPRSSPPQYISTSRGCTPRMNCAPYLAVARREHVLRPHRRCRCRRASPRGRGTRRRCRACRCAAARSPWCRTGGSAPCRDRAAAGRPARGRNRAGAHRMARRIDELRVADLETRHCGHVHLPWLSRAPADRPDPWMHARLPVACHRLLPDRWGWATGSPSSANPTRPKKRRGHRTYLQLTSTGLIFGNGYPLHTRRHQ